MTTKLLSTAAFQNGLIGKLNFSKKIDKYNPVIIYISKKNEVGQDKNDCSNVFFWSNCNTTGIANRS